jgi:hypothetical protein
MTRKSLRIRFRRRLLRILGALPSAQRMPSARHIFPRAVKLRMIRAYGGGSKK